VVAILLEDSRVDPRDIVHILGLATGECQGVFGLLDWLVHHKYHNKSDNIIKLVKRGEYHFGEGNMSARVKIVTMLISDKRIAIPSDRQVWVPWDRPENGTWRPWDETHRGWSDTQNTLLPWAAARGATELVRLLLLDKRFCPKKALGIAARDGHLELVRMFMTDSRIETDDTSNAICLAAGNGKLHVVCFFMTQEQKVTPDALRDAVKLATANGHTYVLNVLLYSD